MSSKESKTREKILDAAWKLMEKQQGKGVRMGDIAQKAGVSRQAVYLHFTSRVELMRATTKHVDEVLGLDDRLKCVYEAADATQALERFVEVWGNYIPEIYGISKALMVARDHDEAAAEAWDECMSCLKDASNEIVKELKADGVLSSRLKMEAAGGLLWTMLSIQNWEQLTIECGWTQKAYVDGMTALVMRGLLD
jgi:AcrR family transcriptional regulator